MNYYNDKKFNEENSVGFCSVTKKNFIKFPRKIRKSYQKPKNYVNELPFDHPIYENHLAGLQQAKIAEYFELNHREGNSKKGIFYIANFDKVKKNK